MGLKEHRIRDEDIWFLTEDIWVPNLTPYDPEQDISLGLTFPLLCNKIIHQRISKFFIFRVHLTAYHRSGASRDNALISDFSDRKYEE